MNFLKDMGPRPEGMSLDRINNNGPYAPGNCRWATAIEQMRNRRTTRKATFNGETLTLYEWAEKTGIPYTDLHSRIVTHKWSVERALTEPVNKNFGSISWSGKSQTLKGWAADLGISYGTLLARYHRGLTGDALFAPK